jgi:hypothetical protein
MSGERIEPCQTNGGTTSAAAAMAGPVAFDDSLRSGLGGDAELEDPARPVVGRVLIVDYRRPTFVGRVRRGLAVR